MRSVSLLGLDRNKGLRAAALFPFPENATFSIKRNFAIKLQQVAKSQPRKEKTQPMKIYGFERGEE